MTALIPETLSPDAVHVLIIGVGRYDDPDLAPLPGAAKSAERLGLFWRDATPSGGRKIGSVEVLISGQQPVPMPIHDGSIADVDGATYEAVGAAIKAWASRCATGAMGVLHWIGHGETVALTDESSLAYDAGHILYTEDLDSFGEAAVPAGYRWDDTYRAFQRLIPVPTLCFIDACRNVGKGSRGGYRSPWRVQRGDIKKKADILLATQSGEQAHCAREKRAIGTDFVCGALFSEAVLLGLSKFGADAHDGREGPAVFLDVLLRAVEARLERWCRSDSDLRDLQMPEVKQSVYRGPIVNVPAPFGMIDVMNPARVTKDIDCDIIDPTGTVHRLTAGTGCWEADFPHEAGYDARLASKAGWGRGPVRVTNKPFLINTPHQVVEVV